MDSLQNELKELKSFIADLKADGEVTLKVSGSSFAVIFHA